MKYILFIAFMMLPFSVIAKDDSGESLSIAVVDVQQLMNKSKAAKSIQKQGKNLRKRYQGKIKNLEKELKKAESKVVEAGKAKDQEKFIESRKIFQEELIDSQKKLRGYDQKLDKAIATALNTLRDEIIEIVDDMTVENQYDIVITRADVMTVSRDLDITADIMKTLNKTMPSVKVRD